MDKLFNFPAEDIARITASKNRKAETFTKDDEKWRIEPQTTKPKKKKERNKKKTNTSDLPTMAKVRDLRDHHFPLNCDH